MDDLRPDDVGEGADRRIIVLHRGVIILHRHVDAVLGAFELGHQIGEARLALEVGILLDGDEQAAERARYIALRLLERLNLCGVVQIVGAELHLRRRRARLDDAFKRRLLDIGGALRSFDEVGDQVGAPLIGGFDIRPFGLGRFFLGRDAVDAAGGQAHRGDGQDQPAGVTIGHGHQAPSGGVLPQQYT